MMWKILTGAAFLLLFMAPGAVRTDEPRLEKAVFAGGCFWCMEPPFEKLDGVAARLPCLPEPLGRYRGRLQSS